MRVKKLRIWSTVVLMLCVLGVKEVEGAEVQMLEWGWKDKENHIEDKSSKGWNALPRDDYAKNIEGNQFVIEDITTGKLIKAIRTGGQHHNDIETVSKEDSRLLEEIGEVPTVHGGGAGDWVGRPVLVHYKGEVYGGSITVKQHAGRDDKPARETCDNRSGNFGTGMNYDSVKGNGADGHFDLYWKKSMGHGTPKEKPSHNKALEYVELNYGGKEVPYKGIDGGVTNEVNKGEEGIEGGLNSEENEVEGSEEEVKEEELAPDGNLEGEIGNVLGDSGLGFVTGKLIEGRKDLAWASGWTTTPPKGVKIKEGEYFFTGDGALIKKEGVEYKGDTKLFTNILKGKERRMVRDIQGLQKDYFKNNRVRGDLVEVEGRYNLWKIIDNPKAIEKYFWESTEGSRVTISDGSKEYTIVIPPGSKIVGYMDIPDGKGGTISEPILERIEENRGYINSFLSNAKRYMDAVKEGINNGMMLVSYNLYSMYPTTQVPMGDVLDIKNINKNGLRDFKKNAKMRYALDYFYHPSKGRVEGEEIPASKSELKKEFSEEEFKAYTGVYRKSVEEVKYTGELEIPLKSEYVAFMNGSDVMRHGSKQIRSEYVKDTNGVKGFHTEYNNDRGEPANLVGTMFRVIVPNKLEKNGDKYNLKDKDGYRVLEDVWLLITEGKVYNGTVDTMEEVGVYEDYGIKEEGLGFYYTEIEGKRVGAVLPLWYSEAVYDGNEDKLYYTGRTVKFDNDYVRRMEYDRGNVELFSAEEKAGGKREVLLKEYGFPKEGDYLKMGTHRSLGKEPEELELEITFEAHKEKPEENHSVNGGVLLLNEEVSELEEVERGEVDELSKLNGFTIVRNNNYLKTGNLLSWLGSNEARALENVEAEELEEKILGEMELGNGDLTYDEWKRMEEIKTEMSEGGSLRVVLLKVTRVITMVFGVMLIFYSMLLVFAYYIDIFAFFEVDVLRLLTFGRYYAVTNKEEMEYVGEYDGEARAITIVPLLVLAGIGIFVGGLFVLSSPIMRVIGTMYLKIRGLIGGI